MKRYSAFPKAPVLLEPHHQIFYCYIQDTGRGGITPFREAVGVFYRLSHGVVRLSSALGVVRDAFNKFPDFFVQALNIVVDSWKFSVLLPYII